MKNGKPLIRGGLLALCGILFFSCATAEGANEAPASYGDSAESRETDDSARMIAYTVSLSLEVNEPEASKTEALKEIENYRGYLIREASSSFTARIPAENMDAFLAKMKTLGDVDRENKTGTDITEKYRDDLIRLESMKAVRDRYQNLLEKAETVEEILSIEKELERVNTEIEILEGRKQAAEQSVRYSSITVYFDKKAKPGPLGWIFYGLYRGLKWLFVWD